LIILSFKLSGVSDAICDLEIKIPGSYEYAVEYEEFSSGRVNRSLFPGYFSVEPRLLVPEANFLDSKHPNGTTLLPLDAIVMLTIIPKWMPTVSHWIPYFNAFASTGYNMIHFAPINQRGISNSPYSIYDQLSLSDELFDKKLSEAEKEIEFKARIDQILVTCGIFSTTDVVWNHTACNSLWLEDHPESGYNLRNSPHLRPAYELDEAIMDFSDTFTSNFGVDANIKTEEDLAKAIHVFKSLVFPAIRLWEFYVLDVKGLLFSFAQTWNFTEHRIPGNHRFKDVDIGSMSLKQKADYLYSQAYLNVHVGHRFAKSLDTAISTLFIQKDLADRNAPCTLQSAMKEYEQVVNEINLQFYKEYDSDLECIVSQIWNRAKYLRLEENGPHLGPVSRWYIFRFSMK
jgi:glycogen debranching enzyme